MKNILIVCVDKDLRKDVSKMLATDLKCICLDVNELLNYELLNAQDIPLSQASTEMRNMEQKAIKRALEYKNCIITISHDLFVANDNFKLFDINKIYIHLPTAYLVAKSKRTNKQQIEQNLSLYHQIGEFVKSKCDFVVDKGIKTIQEIGKEIKDMIIV